MNKETLEVLLTLLIVAVALLFVAVVRLGNIDRRLRERFPTAREEDYDWSQRDPMGHWEAHKNDKN